MQRVGSLLVAATGSIIGFIGAVLSLALWVAIAGFSLLFVQREFGVHPFQPVWINFAVGTFLGVVTVPLAVVLLLVEAIGFVVSHLFR